MHKKQDKNFAARKRRKRKKRTRKSPKKAKPGAFWVLEGMRTVKGRCKRMGKTGKLGGNRGTDLSRLPPRSARGRAPLALARPSARGFGVDVGERTREREKADVIRFPPQVPERAVLVWCCELFLEKDCVSTTTSSFERKAPPPGGWPSWPGSRPGRPRGRPAPA